MSDLGVVGLQDAPPKVAGLFREKWRDKFSPIFSKRKTLMNFGYKVIFIPLFI